jgi:hypothetical protein
VEKKFFYVNLAIVALSSVLLFISGELILSTAIVMTPVYIFFYFIYIVVNRIGKKNFDNKLLFIPFFIFVFCVSYSLLVIKLYEMIDKEFFSYISIGENNEPSCRKQEKCYVMENRIKIRNYTEKNYVFRHENGCLLIYSPYYALVQYSYENCHRKDFKPA